MTMPGNKLTVKHLEYLVSITLAFPSNGQFLVGCITIKEPHELLHPDAWNKHVLTCPKCVDVLKKKLMVLDLRQDYSM